MTHITPDISIVVPVYNMGAFLSETINCVLAFHKINYELIIVNDGSTEEETLNILAKFRDHNSIQVIDTKNQGVAKARNTGLAASSAPYVLPLDADNLIEEAYCLEGVQIMNNSPEIGVVYCHPTFFGAKTGQQQLPSFSLDRLLSSNFIDNCCVIRKSSLLSVNGYREDMPHTGHEDWALWIDLAQKGTQFQLINEHYFHYRVRENSMLSNALTVEKRSATFGYLLQHFRAFYEKHASEVIVFLNELYIHHDTLFSKATQEQKVLTAQIKSLLQQQKESITQIQDFKHKNEALSVQVQKSIEANTRLSARLNELESKHVFRLYKKVAVLIQKIKANKSQKASGNMIKKIISLVVKRGWKWTKKILAFVFKHLYLRFESRRVVILSEEEVQNGLTSVDKYNQFIQRNVPLENDIIRQRKEIDTFDQNPLFSIVIPVYNPPIQFLKEALDSISNQSYQNWEVCLADDCSTDPEVKKVLLDYRKRDPRFKVLFRKENGHISRASNSALTLAEGDFIVLMDQDDTLALDALYWVVKEIEEAPDVDLIYTDEDKINEEGVHSQPHFKPDWSPDNLLSRNYLGHLTIFKASILHEIGGWRIGFEGSQDYDLVLRFTERCKVIKHIPKVLYHWRIHSLSAAGSEEAKPYAYVAAQKAITEALERRGHQPNVEILDDFRGYQIRLGIHEPDELVSIIIPTKNKADLVKTCIDSIFEKSTYKAFEVILIDNNSDEDSFFALCDTYRKQYPDQFKCVEAKFPFNFSKLMNLGRKNAEGKYLVLLNNDTEVITPDWLECMVEQAQRKEIGVVGVKLLYPNNTVQHAGVIVGLGGVAGHVLIGEDRKGPGYFNYVNLLNNYSAVTAACVMVRTAVYDEVKGFNEQFEVEYNDVDFCLNIQQKGYYNLYVPHCELYHYESISRGHPHLTKESFERHKSEINMFKEKWEHVIDHDPCYNPNLSLGAHDFRMKDM